MLDYFRTEFNTLAPEVQYAISNYRPKKGSVAAAVREIEREGMDKAFPALPNIIDIWGSAKETPKKSLKVQPTGCKRAEVAKASSVFAENPGAWGDACM